MWFTTNRLAKIGIKKVTLCLLVLFSTQVFGDALSVDITDNDKTLLRAFAPWPMVIPADPGNEYSGLQWAEDLGARLFSDSMLSADQSISCASCHQNDLGLADGTPLPQNGAQQHVRNTQGLLNVSYQRWLGWDGGADSLWSASLRPILSEVEMNSNISDLSKRLRNAEYFVDALNQADVELDQLDNESVVVVAGKLLGAYIRTLVSSVTSFDRFVASVLDDLEGRAEYPLSAQRGMKIFFGEGNCFVCHFGANFSNGEFHDIGRPFFTGVGQVDAGRFSGIKRLKNDPYNLEGVFNGTQSPEEILKTRTVKTGQVNFGQWRTPSLRNLSLTAPYMHDGSLATLRDVVNYYAEIDPARLHSKGESILKPFQWSDSEREDLVAFLTTLSK